LLSDSKFLHIVYFWLYQCCFTCRTTSASYLFWWNYKDRRAIYWRYSLCYCVFRWQTKSHYL